MQGQNLYNTIILSCCTIACKAAEPLETLRSVFCFSSLQEKVWAYLACDLHIYCLLQMLLENTTQMQFQNKLFAGGTNLNAACSLNHLLI